MSNKNTKKNLGTEFDIFDRTGEVGMYNFSYMNSSFYEYLPPLPI